MTRLLFLPLLSLFLGCGSTGLPVVPVRGKVTFNGQTPPVIVAVIFAPISTENNLPKIPVRVLTRNDGTFTVESEQTGKGLIPGKYAVNMECWKTPPSMEAPGSGVSYIPADFHPAEVVVAAGGSGVDVPIDVPTSP